MSQVVFYFRTSAKIFPLFTSRHFLFNLAKILERSIKKNILTKILARFYQEVLTSVDDMQPKLSRLPLSPIKRRLELLNSVANAENMQFLGEYPRVTSDTFHE